MDESGHEAGPVCVMGGFVGSVQQWTGFEADWKAGLGQRPHLHMTDLRWGQKWRPRTEKLLQRLGPIPYKHGLTPVLGVVTRDFYDECMARNGALLVDALKPWTLSFRKVLFGLAAWLPKDETLKITFERQNEFSPMVGRLWDDIKAKHPKTTERLVAIQFVDKGATYCTEPADYLAFQLREYFTDMNSPKAQMGFSIFGDDKVDPIGGVYMPNELREYVRHLSTKLIMDGYREL